jgi:ATP-dependent HslUV protease subunit HslV
MSKSSENTRIRQTTVLGIIHNGKAVIGADGQATMGNTVIKSNVKKVRVIDEGRIAVGFAGSTSDGLTLLERFEEKLNMYRDLRRAAVELAKAWRSDKYLRNLEAMLVVMNKEECLIISGNGDVLAPEDQIVTIGSGSMYAKAAAMAMVRHAPDLSAREIVEQSLHIAADICIYTNHNLEIIELS